MLEQVEISRTFSKQIRLGKVVEGDMEMYVYAQSTAWNFLIAGAFGGSVTSATATGETAGGLAFTHTYNIGDMVSNSFSSICINNRKGNSSGAQIFQYSGVRVNECTFTGEIDEALKCTMSIMAKDETTTTNDVSGSIGVNSFQCLNFVDGRISVEADSIGAVTTTSFWHVQSVELGISNSLKSDSGSRRIGSNTVDVMPPGIASFTFNCVIRFDTSTAYDAMIANTTFAAELEFQGPTLGTSVVREGLRISMPIVKISDAGDPEIGGPDEVLTSNVTFHVLRDDATTTGFAMRAAVTNVTANYNT